MKTKVLFKPDNELLALSIKSFLDSEGIYAIVRSYQIPAYDSIAQMMRPNWGEIIVSEEDYQRAKELLAVFLKTTKSESRAVEPEPNHNDKPDDDANV